MTCMIYHVSSGQDVYDLAIARKFAEWNLHDVDLVHTIS